ncbi:hypothetical protein TanjilG_12150 [Lupinus angustifolius]|uniref:Uncharacterized protein n=1 Tax=Lupinus angustifolius TaxID=3871 RepID=A0A1J7HA05_LUPAN|nr:PREDICTED: uncharacterized protein LOC109363651 [Lupinus angustifolius]OIV98564.1 hypothetical protein TanjilG_12150 [Lupinus angustifolius]
MRIPVFMRRITNEPLLWTVMTFVSSIVGFTCFPMSTTFEDLFGRPNPMKTVIYFSVVTLILTVTIFTMIREPHMLELEFTKKWWFKAQMSFGVLIIPFFNMFGKDQREEGMHKDEEKLFGRLMDLFTTGAFSLTALSLSRELWLGIGATIFNSFLGVLLVLGMKLSLKIGLSLAIFLCYLLVMIRFYVDDHYNNDNPFTGALENAEMGNIRNDNLHNPRSDDVQVISTTTNVDGQNESLRWRGHGLNDYKSDDNDNDNDDEDEDELIYLYYRGILDKHPRDKS